MKTVVWDVDDVLNNFTRQWLEEAWLPAHPGCPVTYDHLTENPPHRLLGVEQSVYHDSIDTFRLSPKAAAMPPVPEVAAWFRAYGSSFRHVALTARSVRTVPPAAEWVFRNFGCWIRTFHFVPSPRPNENPPPYQAKKKDALLWLDVADVFVDDSPENIAGASRLDIPALLMPRPWNGGGDITAALEKLNAMLRK